MKSIQTYKLMKNLNEMIKSGEISKPIEKELTLFDVKYLSLTVESVSYNLTIKVLKTSSSIYGDYYTVYFNDPNHKLLDNKISGDAVFSEQGTKLTRMIFNRLTRYRNKGK